MVTGVYSVVAGQFDSVAIMGIDGVGEYKKRRPLRINDLRFCCVQDEDINMISIDFGISIMILTYLKINKLQM